MLEFNYIVEQLNKHLQVAESLRKPEIIRQIHGAGALAIKTFLQGNKLLLFGNGGSASEAQHIASGFTGRFVKERHGLPAIALTTNTSALTAIANDYDFSRVFARQVQALARAEDLVIALSLSGKSPNVIEGLKAARELSCATIGLSGKEEG